MDYIGMMEYAKSMGLFSFDIGSSKILKLFIDNDKREYYSVFNKNAWTSENICSLLSKADCEEYISFLKSFNFNYWDETVINILITELINKQYYDFIFDKLSDFVLKNENLFLLFLSNLKDATLTYQKLNYFIIYSVKNEKQRFKIIKHLIEFKRFELIAYLISSNISIRSDELDLIETEAKDIATYLVFFNLKIPNSYFKNRKNFFEILFMNGYATALDCICYSGYDEIRDFVESKKEILDKIVEYSKNANDSFLETTKRVKKLKYRADYLKIMIERKKYNMLYFFDSSACNLENQLLYYKIKKEDVNFVETYQTRSFESNCPFLTYKNAYSFDKAYIYSRPCGDVISNETFSDFSNSYRIGENISKGLIEDNNYITKFYKLIFDTKSPNIHRLIMALTEKNIANLNRLIDDNGFTEYLKKFLVFDFDYVTYKGLAILETEHVIEYATFVRTLCLNESMKKSLYCLDLDENNLKEYFTDKTITRKCIDKLFRDKDGILALVVMLQNEYDLDLSDVEKNVICKYSTIKSQKQRDSFLEYCLKNKNELTNEQVDKVYELIERIINSNSFEIRKQADNIVTKLINKDDSIGVYNEIENIFTDGAAPEFIKRFVMYKLLYGNVDISKDYSVTSPILKSVSREEADKIIFDDLLRISLATNSLDVKKYLDILTKGYELYCSIGSNHTGLSELSSQLLHAYRIRLEFIAKYFAKLDYESVEDDYQAIFNIERAYLKGKYGGQLPTGFHWPLFNDWILSDMSYTFKSMMQLQLYMSKHGILKTVFEEAKHLHEEKMVIKKGDFLKGINSDYLDNIFSFGSLSVEHLGEDAKQDGTHLDTDMSLIDKDVASIPELLKEKLTACSWGDMQLLISSDYIKQLGDYVVTIDENGKKEFSDDDKKKIEIFCHSSTDNHWCIRTGFPITYVKAIIASKNFDRARFIVLKNDFFVPIYDNKGNLIFSYEDYYRGRKALDGLSYYNCNQYTISDNLYNDEIVEIVRELESNQDDVKAKREAIYAKLNPIFKKYFDGVKHFVNSSVNKGIIEVIDTGSTGRGTNLIGGGDFDFTIRLDQEFMDSEKFAEFSGEVYEAFGKPVGDKRCLRLKDVRIDGIDVPLEIDITFMNKNNKVVYSTGMCLSDRLNTIENLYPSEYPFVIANILYAKRFFKNLGIYKVYEGGLQGVGIENFVLQHNGSFYDAVSHFVSVAEECKTLDEFKYKFPIYSFGKTFYAYANLNRRYDFPYDNYVDGLTSSSFDKMLRAFKEYLGYENEHKFK